MNNIGLQYAGTKASSFVPPTLRVGFLRGVIIIIIGFIFRYSQGLFYAMYYGSGQWSRRGAGTQARYEMEGVEVTTNMTYNTDTYKPVILWDIYEVGERHIISSSHVELV